MEGQPDIYQQLSITELEQSVHIVEQYQEVRRAAAELGQPVPASPVITFGGIQVPVRAMHPEAIARLFAEYLARQQKPGETQSLRVPDSTESLWMPWDSPQDYYNARAERMP